MKELIYSCLSYEWGGVCGALMWISQVWWVSYVWVFICLRVCVWLMHAWVAEIYLYRSHQF